VKHSCL